MYVCMYIILLHLWAVRNVQNIRASRVKLQFYSTYCRTNFKDLQCLSSTAIPLQTLRGLRHLKIISACRE